MGLTRRGMLMAGHAGGAALAIGALLWPWRAHADDETLQLVERFFGRTATESDRIHLVMPKTFPTGYTVPMSLDVDSPMTEADHVGKSAYSRRRTRSSRSPASTSSRNAASPACRRASASPNHSTWLRSPR